jgi:hypothetical protein
MRFAVATVSAEKERRGAVPAPLQPAGPHRRCSLAAGQRPCPERFVGPRHHGLRGRGHKRDNVAHLGDTIGGDGQPEGGQPVRFQPEGTPDGLHRADRDRQTAIARQPRESRWVRPSGWPASVRAITQPICASSIVRGAPGRGTSRRTFNALCQIVAAPFAARHCTHIEEARTRLDCQAGGAVGITRAPLAKCLRGGGREAMTDSSTPPPLSASGPPNPAMSALLVGHRTARKRRKIVADRETLT